MRPRSEPPRRGGDALHGEPGARGGGPGGGTARLFLALWPGRALRPALADWLAAARWPAGAALVAPSQWHLTLHFIGPVPTSRLPALPSALHVPVGRFALEFGTAEVWRGGLAVLLPHRMPAALQELHRALAGRLQAAGLPVDARPFRPHLTLARRAAGAVLPAPPLPPIRWPMHEVALVASDQGYRTIARWH